MDNKPKEDKKKKGLLYGCLTAIGIIVVLLILMVSCTAYFGSSSDTDEIEETETTETTVTDKNESSYTPVEVSYADYLGTVDTYYNQINRLITNSSEFNSEQMIEKLNNQIKYMNNFLSNPLKDDVTEYQKTYIEQYRNLIQQEIDDCNLLIQYYQTGDQTYLTQAQDNLNSVSNQKTELNNQYIENL